MSRPRTATLITACAGVLALTAFLGPSSFPLLGAAQAGGKPLKVGGDVQRPRPLSTPAPVYPEAARASKAEGVTVLDCVIDEQGRVAQAKVAKSSGDKDLDQAALDAVNAWTFQPATLKGKPVAVTYALTFNFKLDEKDKKQ